MTPVNIYILSEASLGSLLWDVLNRRPTVVLGVWAYIRPMQVLLTWLLDRLVTSGRVRGLHQIDGLPWHENVPGRGGFYNDVHHRAEPSLRALYALQADESLTEEFTYAFRKGLTDAVGKLTPMYLTAEWISENWAAGSWRLVGMPPLMEDLASILKPPFAPILEKRWYQGAINSINFLVVAIGVCLWLTARVRPNVVTENLDLMFDEADDMDRILIHRAASVGKSFVVLDRSLAHRLDQKDKLTPFRHCLREDARIPLSRLLPLCKTAVSELAALWKRHRRKDQGVFSQWSAQIVRKAIFSALFCRYRPKRFWARDDYSTEHVIRSQEVRKIGGFNYGMSHGLPVNTYVHMWREIDYDTYFTFGSDLTRYYKDSWSPGMKIIPTGPFRQPVDMRERIAAAKRGKDIVFFAMAAHEMPKIAEIISQVAAHFTDRRLLLKMKPGRSQHDRDKLATSFHNAPANLVSTTTDSYQLMLECSYAITSGSSTTVESLSFGLPTFVIDVDPSLRAMYYRNFPGLTVNDAETIISRIEAIEAGTQSFDFNAFSELVVLDGPHPSETISQALGIEPKPAAMVDHVS